MKSINITAKPIKLKAFMLCAALIFCCINSFGQSITWQKILNNNNGTLRKIQQTSDEGYIAIGYDRINSMSKMYLIKLNNVGNLVWTKIIGIGNTEGYWLEETTDKGFIFAGDTDSGLVDDKFYIVKTDSNGNVQWEKTFTNSTLDQAYCVKQTLDKGFVVIGRTTFQNAGVYIIKTDSLGNVQSQKVYYNSPENKIIREIIVLQNGYLAIGYVFNTSFSDIYLMRFNNNLDTIWTKKIGGSKNDYGYSIDKINENRFIIGGTSNSFQINNIYQSISCLIDSNGSLIWQKTYFNNGFDKCNSIRYKNVSGFVMVGSSDSLNNLTYKAKLRFIDLNGNVLFENSMLPETRGAGFESVEMTDDNGFILAGYITTNTAVEKMYIVKTDSLFYASPIGLNIINTQIPDKFNLKQNYPNPFNPTTNIQFDISEIDIVTISIYDVLGRQIENIDFDINKAGSYEFNWNAKNYSSGIYLCKVTAGNNTKTIKMILQK